MTDDESSIHYTGPTVQDESNLTDALKSIFSYAFTLNCHIDNASITEEEKDTLTNLEISELFENFKDLILDLLKFKQRFKNSSMSELANRSDQFETIIQKLEAKIRTHIGVEQQLKLHIETQQGQLEDLQKTIEATKSYAEDTKDIKSLKEKIIEYDKDSKRKDSEISRLTHENQKLRKIIEDKTRQMQTIKKESRGKSDYLESNDYIKRQIEEQNSQILKIQQKLKKEVYGWTPKRSIRNKSNKRVSSPVNSSQYVSPAFKIAQKYIKGHVRSYSEH